ncbi:MAG: hypothetical protein LBT59_30270, partial [Clostridiales bacterium]|nr:hypothetical protein [Clostridiales bacterium]
MPRPLHELNLEFIKAEAPPLPEPPLPIKEEAESFAQGFQPDLDAFPAFPPLSAIRPGEPLDNPSGIPPSAPAPYGFDQAAPFAPGYYSDDAAKQEAVDFLQSQDGPFGFDSSLFQPEDVKNFSLGSLYQDDSSYYQSQPAQGPQNTPLAPPLESFAIPATDGFAPTLGGFGPPLAGFDPFATGFLPGFPAAAQPQNIDLNQQQLPQSFALNQQGLPQNFDLSQQNLPQSYDLNQQNLPQGFDPNFLSYDPQNYDPNLAQPPQNYDQMPLAQPPQFNPPNPLDGLGFETTLFQPEDIKDFSLGSIYPNETGLQGYTEAVPVYPGPIVPDGQTSYFPDPAEIYKQTVLGKIDPAAPEYAFSQAELERRAMLERLYPSVPQVSEYAFDPDEIYRQALVGKVGSVEGHGQEFSYPNGKPGSADFSHFEYSEMLPPDGQPRWRPNSGDPYANARQTLKGTFDPDEGSKKNYPFVESPWLVYGDRPSIGPNPQTSQQAPGPFATGKEDDGKNQAATRPAGNPAPKKGKKPPFDDAPPGPGNSAGKPGETSKKKPKPEKGKSGKSTNIVPSGKPQPSFPAMPGESDDLSGIFIEEEPMYPQVDRRKRPRAKTVGSTEVKARYWDLATMNDDELIKDLEEAFKTPMNYSHEMMEARDKQRVGAELHALSLEQLDGPGAPDNFWLEETPKDSKAKKAKPAKAPASEDPKTRRNRIISDALFYFGIMAMVLATIYYQSKSKGPIKLFNHSVVTVSDTISGTIKKGSLVLVKNVDPATIAVGDNITFMTGENTTRTRQVLDIFVNYDNSGSRGFVLNDEEIARASDLLGSVSLAIPVLGAAFEFVGQHLYLVFIFFAFLMILSFALRGLLKGDSEPARAKKKKKKSPGGVKAILPLFMLAMDKISFIANGIFQYSDKGVG